MNDNPDRMTQILEHHSLALPKNQTKVNGGNRKKNCLLMTAK